MGAMPIEMASRKRKTRSITDILAFLEKSVVDCIENSKNCNCNYKVHGAANFEWDTSNTQEFDDTLEEPENHTIDDEDEETECQEDEGESDEFQERADDEVQDSEDDASDEKKLKTSSGSDFWEEVADGPKDDSIKENGEKNMHSASIRI